MRCAAKGCWKIAVATLLCSAAWGQSGEAQSTEAAGQAADCQRLVERTGHAYSILSADFLEAENGAAARCLVLGVLPPEIVFEVALPAAWNGRILMHGNGGYAGTPPRGRDPASRSSRAAAEGFAAVYTNTGHDAVAEPLGSFALNNRQKEIDYAFRAVHLSIETAKELVALHYGRPADYSYWLGCSTGGRQGLMSAQRFPRDFDGIVAGAPVLNVTDTQIWGAWNALALEGTGMDLAKIALAGEAVYRRCDALDGLRDGLLEDPRACDFDPTLHLPRCSEAASEGCFSAAQIAALQKVYGGVISRGETLFPGLPAGAEAAPPSGPGKEFGGWAGWLIETNGPSWQQRFAESFLRYMAFEPDDPSYDWRSFDFDADPYRMDFMRSILDATDPDLTRFRDAGGKLLMYFGWADTALNPMMAVNYYEDALRASGPGAQDFFRLFMVPGMFHCGGGLGVSRADYLGILMNWVENGEAPDRIEAARVIEGKTEMTRPLCPYPQIARYDGQGDPNSADSFACAEPPASPAP